MTETMNSHHYTNNDIEEIMNNGFEFEARFCIIDGIAPNTNQLILQTLAGIVWCEITYRTLKKLEKNFGDVL